VLVDVFRTLAGQLLQLVDRADAMQFAVLAAPDRDRRAPETVAADVPVARVLQPVAEPSLAQVIRHPAGGGVVLEQRLLDGSSLTNQVEIAFCISGVSLRQQYG